MALMWGKLTVRVQGGGFFGAGCQLFLIQLAISGWFSWQYLDIILQSGYKRQDIRSIACG
jgi:hypothetical protein